MEKRAVAPLVLGGAGLVLVVAVAVLVVKVRAGAPAVSVSAADQSRASARVSLPAERARGGPPEPSPPRPDVVGQPGPAEEPTPLPPSSSPPAAGEPGTATDSTGKQLGPEEWTALAEQMVEANRLYDRGDYEGAGRAAEEILERHPDIVKMLRIATSSACILGDAGAARVHFDRLPASDQEQIARRCRRYGVEF
jgi:hypothetical protein